MTTSKNKPVRNKQARGNRKKDVAPTVPGSRLKEKAEEYQRLLKYGNMPFLEECSKRDECIGKQDGCDCPNVVVGILRMEDALEMELRGIVLTFNAGDGVRLEINTYQHTLGGFDGSGRYVAMPFSQKMSTRIFDRWQHAWGDPFG